MARQHQQSAVASAANPLHHYDLQLCNYAVGNIAQYMNRPAFSSEVEAVLTSRPLLDYLQQAQDNRIDADERRLLFNDDELYRLELIFADELDRPWIASEPLHRRYIQTVQEVRDNISRQAAEDWCEVCAAFAKQLEDRHMRLSEGIAIVREWVGRLRTLLRVMGTVTLLPAPEGSFPTPTCPEPPQRSCPPAALPSRPDENEDDGVKGILADIQESQREVRNLLVGQRTVKDWYSVEEFASLVGKSEFTCREWCRLSRIHATKKNSGRGKHQSWAIGHDELLRYQKEGLLSLIRPSTK